MYFLESNALAANARPAIVAVFRKSRRDEWLINAVECVRIINQIKKQN
jgi:hypothetical protein